MDAKSKGLYSHKIKSVEEVVNLIGSYPHNKKIIMCHGTFDVVHPGHIRHLLYAKTKADILIASLTSDMHINKANMRPYVPEDLRAINLATLEMVDYVIIDREPTPLKNLSLIQPNFYAKGYEYTAGSVHKKTKEEIAILDSYGGEMIFTPGDIVYSSSALIELEAPSISVEKLLTIMHAEKITFKNLRDTIKKFKNFTVHVVGDTIVDSYTNCSMAGGMTKTPTMSVKIESKTDYVGGAGIVAKHIKSAGANVVFTTVLGDDDCSKFVLNDLNNFQLKCIPLTDKTRPTTNKNAIVVDKYRLLKLDTVDNAPISEKILTELTKRISNTKTDAIVFSDFRHGIFNRSTLSELISAIPKDVFKVADSQVASRWGNILDFKGFDLITPNEREARFALGDQDSVIRPLALSLHKESECKTLILKCGSRGILTYRSNSIVDYRAFFSLESFTNNVVDAVGAGDALLAYATLGMLASGNDIIASILGNIAAGIECEQDGNLPISQELMNKKIEEIEKISNYN